VKFWDSSAVIGLCVEEPASPTLRALLRADASVVVWWSTRIECLSGLLRRSREGSLGAAGLAQSRAVLRALADSWSEVVPSEMVRGNAERLLAVHALRPADAMQLGAAIVWRGSDVPHAELLSFDARLREAAAREGFEVLPTTV
jgi:predicted nucleic acid-binding protein